MPNEKKNIIVDYWPQLIYIIAMAFAAGVTHNEIKDLFSKNDALNKRLNKKIEIIKNHETRLQELEKCNH